MKFFLLFCLVSITVYETINAAAVDTVVEKEIGDAHQDETTTISLDSVDQDCHQAREQGRCFALFHRYAFNAESLKCEHFIYGGCGGNQNNFESLEDCERKCLKKKKQEEEDQEEKKEDEDDHTKLPEHSPSDRKIDDEINVEQQKSEDDITPTTPSIKNN